MADPDAAFDWIGRCLEGLVERVEDAGSLDGVARVLAGLASPLFPAGKVKDVASGTPVGHPVHPVLVTIPMGSWFAAGVLDVVGGASSHVAARRLVGFGLLAAAPAGFTGVSDWLETDGAERRVGLVHAALNYTAIGLYATSWLQRRRGRHLRGKLTSALGAAVLGAAGWFGGHLVYAMGVGVDTTVFLQFPTDWADVCAAQDVIEGQAISVMLDGVAIVLTRIGGQPVAMADRCTHRGGPLHEGAVDNGCISCPWHGSRFNLQNGVVDRGPATRPQPILEVRVTEGRVQVRRSEARSLRTNPA